VIIGALLVHSIGCASPQPSDPPQVLVVVGDTELTRDDFERTYVTRLISSGANDTPDNRRLHLNNLIDAELLRQEARRKGLEQDSLGRTQLETIRKKVVGGLYFERAFLNSLPPPTEEEIRRAFARWKEKAVVRHLFYRDSVQARQAFDRLEAGVSFLDEAQRCYHTPSFDSSAGYIGPVGYFEVDDAFAEAAFSLKQHQYSRPVRSRFGYHIIFLEDRVVSPLLTESEFQTRRKGISSKWALRKRRLEGDRFVRSFMQSLDVKVDPEAIQSLSAAIQLIERSVVAEPPTLSDEIGPTTLPNLHSSDTLAWYRFEGEKRAFTLRDYAAWFDELPFAEARHRTAASVGRALRNEAMALAGDSMELGKEPEAEHEELYLERIFLAGRMREYLHETTAPNVTDEEIDALTPATFDSSIAQMDPAEAAEQRQAVRARLAPLVAERRLLEQLRAATPVRVDSVLFAAMSDPVIDDR